jgi:hypothetical protein
MRCVLIIKEKKRVLKAQQGAAALKAMRSVNFFRLKFDI